MGDACENVGRTPRKNKQIDGKARLLRVLNFEFSLNRDVVDCKHRAYHKHCGYLDDPHIFGSAPRVHENANVACNLHDGRDDCQPKRQCNEIHFNNKNYNFHGVLGFWGDRKSVV